SRSATLRGPAQQGAEDATDNLTANGRAESPGSAFGHGFDQSVATPSGSRIGAQQVSVPGGRFGCRLLRRNRLRVVGGCRLGGATLQALVGRLAIDRLFVDA